MSDEYDLDFAGDHEHGVPGGLGPMLGPNLPALVDRHHRADCF
jgi:hypothetical protein